MFEALIIIFLLFAMLITTHPKKLAVAIVVLIALVDRLIEYYGLQWAESFGSLMGISFIESAWMRADMIVVAQCLTSMLLIYISILLGSANDRLFFRIMALFLILTSALIPLYRFDVILSWSAYTNMYHALATLQVFIVYWFSDGFRDFSRNSVSFIRAAFNRSIAYSGDQ